MIQIGNAVEKTKNALTKRFETTQGSWEIGSWIFTMKIPIAFESKLSIGRRLIYLKF